MRVLSLIPFVLYFKRRNVTHIISAGMSQGPNQYSAVNNNLSNRNQSGFIPKFMIGHAICTTGGFRN